jgi:hypothetical protein
MACYFLSQENQYQEYDHERNEDLKTEDLPSMNRWPWKIMDTIPVRLSIYIFCADFLGPVITGI